MPDQAELQIVTNECDATSRVFDRMGNRLEEGAVRQAVLRDEANLRRATWRMTQLRDAPQLLEKLQAPP